MLRYFIIRTYWMLGMIYLVPILIFLYCLERHLKDFLQNILIWSLTWDQWWRCHQPLLNIILIINITKIDIICWPLFLRINSSSKVRSKNVILLEFGVKSLTGSAAAEQFTYSHIFQHQVSFYDVSLMQGDFWEPFSHFSSDFNLDYHLKAWNISPNWIFGKFSKTNIFASFEAVKYTVCALRKFHKNLPKRC